MAFIRTFAKEFRNSVMNNNGLTRFLFSVLCEKIENFYREIQNGGCLKIVDFEICVQSSNEIIK